MKKISKLAIGLVIALVGLIRCQTAQSQNIPDEYQKVLKTLNRQGDYKDGVLKVGIPRNDLQVQVDGVATPTSFGFGGWVAMTAAPGGMNVLMGDLVLLEDEVNPVMSALLDHGLEVTALHNHFFFEEPRVFYMHVMGHGTPMDLAEKVKPGLDLIGHLPHPHLQPVPDPPASLVPGKLDSEKIAKTVGRAGEQLGQVYKITVGRDELKVKDMGATINSRMGLNSWAAFVGNDQKAAIAGDIAMRENEVAPVLRALRSHGLEVVAIHQHMTDSHPIIIFLHYWGKGPAAQLAEGFKATIDLLGKKTDGMGETSALSRVPNEFELGGRLN